MITSLSGAFVFGWAKPVPVDPRYFPKPKQGMMLTAFAGPGTNFLLAIFFAALLWLLLFIVPTAFWLQNKEFIVILQACKAGVYINLSLAWLNLLPIPPLDGSKILAYFLPNDLAFKYMQLERYGFLILLILLFTNLLNKVLTPLIIGSADTLLAYLNVN
ncbi:MAG: site-2 protease family protein [Desulfovibrionaceae bacterium]|nr:site-2 protease family protein [Desulfovibrionaceae bacterium]